MQRWRERNICLPIGVSYVKYCIAELEVFEAFSRSLSHPGDFLRNILRLHLCHFSFPNIKTNPNTIGSLCRNRDQAFSRATNIDRWMRFLDRFWLSLHPGDGIIRPGEIHCFLG